MPALLLRAMFTPKSVDMEARTVEVTFSTGAPVTRYDWMTGTRYIEKLSMEPDAIRLGRLNAGAPVLDAHMGYSVRDQLGAVVPDSAQVSGKKARALVQFSKRADVTDVWQDVCDGLVRNVSTGYVVHAYAEVPGKGDALPVRTAIDWEPYEISMVPMPADPGAQTRSGKPDLQTYPCQIVTSGAAATIQESVTMTEEEQRAADAEKPELIIEKQPPVVPPAARSAEAAEPSDRDLGVQAERERVNGIRIACSAAGMKRSFEQDLINSGVPLVEAQSRVFKALQSLEPKALNGGGQIRGEVGEDNHKIHERAGIENAILNRVSSAMFPLSDVGRQYRGLSLMEIAGIFVRATGVRTTSMSKQDIAGMALGLNQRSGMHTTSDFPELLLDVANKVLRKAYDEAPQTFTVFSRQISVSDFKNISMAQFGEAPALLEVKEHGEFTRGTIVDTKELFALKTYGRIFGITRQALINDDTDAFSRVPMQFGRSARVLESDIIWALITANANMGDGNALFSAAHANLETDGDHISIDSLSRGRASIRRQKGLDGTTRLNLTPKYLIVPPALETIAQQYVGQVTPQSAANANPFSGLLQVVAEPRLEDNSATAWYLAVSPDQLDVVAYAYLEGQTGPTIEQQVGFNIDGLETKCRLDFGAKVVDWRGIHKDPGDLSS